jgi:hypothetical protein
MDVELLIRGLDRCPKCDKNICNHTSIAANINNITVSKKFNISQDLSNIFYSASDTSLFKQLYTATSKKNSTAILNRYSLRPLSCQLVSIDSKTTDKLLSEFHELNEVNELNSNNESYYDNNIGSNTIFTIENNATEKQKTNEPKIRSIISRVFIVTLFLMNTLQAYLLLFYLIYLREYLYAFVSLFLIYVLQFIVFFSNFKHINLKKYLAALVLPILLPAKALVELIAYIDDNDDSSVESLCTFIYYDILYHTLPLVIINIFYLLSLVMSPGFMFYFDKNGLFLGKNLLFVFFF